MPDRTFNSQKIRASLYDKRHGLWLNFAAPETVIQAWEIAEVIPALQAVEALARARNMYAAGFISYDAAPAFDSSLHVLTNTAFPLLWFGLFPDAEIDKHSVLTPPREAPPAYSWKPTVSRPEYSRAIREIKNHIECGHTYQVNYSFRMRSAIKEPPEKLFARITNGTANGYEAFVSTGEWAACSASPELFFEHDGTSLITRPMKGTASRGLTCGDDIAQAEWLRNSEKNQAENVMIVDMARHDLGKIAAKGSVKVERLFEVERYPTLWQMTSTVSAVTKASLTEIFQALFPAASITGAPKARTMDIIQELENTPRGLYTGTIGFITPDSRAQFNVAIRTVVVNQANWQAEYGVGGGIVWDSTDSGEYDECRTKARVLTHPTPEFQLLETLLWTSEEGFFLLDEHLKRLAASAAYFGFRCDTLNTADILQRIAAKINKHSCRIRLLLASDGHLNWQITELPQGLEDRTPVKLCLAPAAIDPDNVFLYHKTINRKVYEEAMRKAGDCDDVLLWNKSNQVTESTIANLVVEIDGKLITPPVHCGLLPGTFRGKLLREGLIQERPIYVDELKKASKLYLINSVRKWREAQLLH